MSYHINPGPNATYSSTQTQSVADVTQGQAITFNTIETEKGITLQTSGGIGTKVALGQIGDYLFTFSAICNATTGSNKAVYIWFRKNGVDVPRSNTIVNMASGNETVMAISLVLSCTTVGDYYELYMAGDTVHCQIKAIPAVVAPNTPVMPAIPSIVLAVNQVA